MSYYVKLDLSVVKALGSAGVAATIPSVYVPTIGPFSWDATSTASEDTDNAAVIQVTGVTTGRYLRDASSSTPITFSCMADIQALTLAQMEAIGRCHIASYWPDLNKGGGEFQFTSDAITPIQGMAIAPSDATTGASGGFVRINVVDPTPEACGAYGDGKSTSPHDDTVAVNALMSWALAGHTKIAINSSDGLYRHSCPAVRMPNNYYVTDRIVIPGGANIDMFGGSIINGGTDINGVLSSGSLTEIEAEVGTYGANYTLKNITIDGNGSSGVGLSLSTAYESEINAKIINFTGTTFSGVTATGTSGSNSLVVSDATNIEILKPFTIDGIVDDTGQPIPYCALDIDGTTLTIKPALPDDVTDAAVTGISASAVGGMVQQTVFQNLITDNCDWPAIFTYNDRVNSTDSTYPSGDNIFLGGGSQFYNYGMYFSDGSYCNRLFGYRVQFPNASGGSGFRTSENSLSTELISCYFETPGSARDYPLVALLGAAERVTNGRLYFNGSSSSAWSRGIVFGPNSGNWIVSGLRCGGYSVENPNISGDYGAIAVYSGGYGTVTNISGLLSAPLSRLVVDATTGDFPAGNYVKFIATAAYQLEFKGVPTADTGVEGQIYTSDGYVRISEGS